MKSTTMIEQKKNETIFTWRGRGGGHASASISDVSMDEAKDFARSFGWPGHSGTRLDYLKDDLRGLKAALGRFFSIRVRDIF